MEVNIMVEHEHHQQLLAITTETKTDPAASPEAKLVASIVDAYCRRHPTAGRDQVFAYLDALAGEIKACKNKIRVQIH